MGDLCDEGGTTVVTVVAVPAGTLQEEGLRGLVLSFAPLSV